MPTATLTRPATNSPDGPITAVTEVPRVQELRTYREVDLLGDPTGRQLMGIYEDNQLTAALAVQTRAGHMTTRQWSVSTIEEAFATLEGQFPRILIGKDA